MDIIKEKKETSVSLSTENWYKTSDPEKEYFTANEMIDAYELGKSSMMSLTRKLVEKTLTDNVKKTTDHRNSILDHLRSNKYNPVTAYLRINSIISYEVLIVLPENEYNDEKFLEMYEYVSEFEEKTKEDVYEIHLRFMDATEDLDETQLQSDGFVFKYTLKK